MSARGGLRFWLMEHLFPEQTREARYEAFLDGLATSWHERAPGPMYLRVNELTRDASLRGIEVHTPDFWFVVTEDVQPAPEVPKP